MLEKSDTRQLLGNVQGSKILLPCDTQNSLEEPFSPLIVQRLENKLSLDQKQPLNLFIDMSQSSKSAKKEDLQNVNP